MLADPTRPSAAAAGCDRRRCLPGAGTGDSTGVTSISAQAPAVRRRPPLLALLRSVLEGRADPQLLAGADVPGRRERWEVLLEFYGRRSGPLRPHARLLDHPHVAAVIDRLEGDWLGELAGVDADRLAGPGRHPARDVVVALRAMAARDRIPAVYRWVADRADGRELRDFLAVEGGPDAGFDDLVASCQIGLIGAPKMALARNYWDEMGGGQADDVHTALHQQMAAALQLPPLPGPDSGLARAALGGLLAGHRWLQPELIGALGLTELQAGPRCRMVLRGLDRIGAPAEAKQFYRVHADVDPVHGRDWLEQAVAPLVAGDPSWGPGILRGAAWRAAVSSDFFAALAAQFGSAHRPAA